ncbi:hypothetical protein [Microbispora bryophytorum]|uniref:hypothetical protein n=1 Tax=Microbispora bryophytorum TaxID=1460882 RepID=UPI0033F5EF53
MRRARDAPARAGRLVSRGPLPRDLRNLRDLRDLRNLRDPRNLRGRAGRRRGARR